MASDGTEEPRRETHDPIFKEMPCAFSSSKPKLLVIMGPTGAGKSKLAINLASHFPIEVINADSMQVYKGLDVLTNKVPLQEQKGVPHHLLGTVSPNVEFTAKHFKDAAIPLIEEIWSRKRLPVIVGGTNYYIQALVSPFLFDDLMDDMEENCSSLDPGDTEVVTGNSVCSYEFLKELDPVAANRIHPNDQRKITQYIGLYVRSGALPSKLLQEKAMEIKGTCFCLIISHAAGQNWGRVDNFNYDCCFICVDASLAALDDYVAKRVDLMINSGLLDEVFEIYKMNADYTRGLRQAIGVREFNDFVECYVRECVEESHFVISFDKWKEDLQQFLGGQTKNQLEVLLTAAIERLRLNTRRLVRRQKRRLKRLEMLFGWSIHRADATESILRVSDDLWASQVVEPFLRTINSFLNNDAVPEESTKNSSLETRLIKRDLWTQYHCQACDGKVLRGVHEWEQHIQGRRHRKRTTRLKKSDISKQCVQ